jgi:hypothetical protein
MNAVTLWLSMKTLKIDELVKSPKFYQVHIPEHSGHGFHVNPAGDSISFRPLIPEESGQ